MTCCNNPRTILLVDDIPEIRTMLGRALAMDGYQVIEAGDGQEALMLYGQNPVDMIITDMKMPNMSGDKLIEEIRQIDKNVKIVAMSGCIEQFRS